MKVLISFSLICVFSLNCFCKDIINISIDRDKVKKCSNDSDDKKIRIEISKDRNQSHENIIHISSSSGSYEHFIRTVTQGQEEQNPWILFQKRMQKSDFKNSSEYTGRILSSIEETGDLWANTRKDSVYNIMKMREEPQSDQIFHDKITNFFENTRNTPTISNRIYPEKAKASGQNEQKDVRIEQYVPISRNKLMIMNSDSKGKKYHNEIPIIHLNARNAWTKTNGSKKYSENFPRTIENSREEKVRRELMNVLQITSSESQRTRTQRETAPCESCKSNDSIGIAIEASNSTIEVSNHEYQANRNTEESESDDQETLDDYPYSASVQRKGAHYVSGALVGERWILSTAAEFYNVRESIRLFRVRVGSVDCKKGGILTPIKSITIHPNFTPGQHPYDVSVLQTADPLILSAVVMPIGISRVTEKVANAKFLTTYWPRIVMKKGVVPSTAKERVKYNSMRVSTQKLVSTGECRKLLASVNVTLNKNSLCLKPVQVHHSDCMPDVGAPVVAVDGLWGITSGWVSPQCPVVLLPTIFTKVSRIGLRTWIEEQMEL